MNELELAEIAEAHRLELGEDFQLILNIAEESWGANRPLERISFRSSATTPGSRLALAILDELKLLICSNVERYAELREKGKALSENAIAAIAGAVAAQVGVAVAIATSGVAFSMLVVLRVGIGVFCRLYPAPRSAAGE